MDAKSGQIEESTALRRRQHAQLQRQFAVGVQWEQLTDTNTGQLTDQAIDSCQAAEPGQS